jgi:hypothetical protein
MSLTITLTHPRFVDGFVEAGNRNGTTAEAIALEFLEAQGKSYADLFGVGVITSAAFIARFTPEEYAGILAAAETDATVAGLLATLLAEPLVNFDDPRLEPGLQTLVTAELLTAERLPELLSYERPVVQEPPAPEEDPAP